MQLSQRKERGLVGICAAAVVLLLLARSLPQGPALLPEGTSMLTVHLLMEMFAVTIAVLIVTISWHTFDPATNPQGNLLIAGFIVIACCDLTHALSYEGMPEFLGKTSTGRAIFFWLMGRTAEVLVLAWIAWGVATRTTRSQAVAIGAGIGAVLVWFGSARLDVFPVAFVEGRGVTPFKVHYELALCAANLLVAAALWVKARREGAPRYRIMAASAFVIGVGELAFTSYVAPSDFLNIFGHVYKLVAYTLLYWATYIASIRAPFDAQIASERRAQESELRIRTLSNNIPNCMVYQVAGDAQLQMQFLHVSDGCERLYGLTCPQMLQDASVFYERIQPDDRQTLRDAAARSMRELSMVDVTMRVRGGDGAERLIHAISAPRRLADGRICWDGIHLDITEQRAMQDRERDNAALLSAVVDSASDAIVGVDADGRIALFNPAAQRIFRYPASSVLGARWATLLPADAGPAVALQDQLGSSRLRGRRSDGVSLELEMSVSQVAVKGRDFLTAILRDITDRARTERALVQYQVELTELTQALLAQEKATTSRLAQVLHDQLGQTLAAIRIDFVTDAQLAGAGEQARHARADRLIDQAIREVRQVLAELRPTVLDDSGLYEALKNELAAPRMAAEGVAISLVAAPEVRAQRWDPNVEYAAFMVAREAINNAIRHARASAVRIQLAGGAARLHMEVSDNGAGFAAAAQAARPGHLGMVGMRERSIAIGGHFEVASAPGQGTTVTLDWQERET